MPEPQIVREMQEWSCVQRPGSFAAELFELGIDPDVRKTSPLPSDPKALFTMARIVVSCEWGGRDFVVFVVPMPKREPVAPDLALLAYEADKDGRVLSWGERYEWTEFGHDEPAALSKMRLAVLNRLLEPVPSEGL